MDMDIEASSELASRVTSLDNQEINDPMKMELHDSISQADTSSSCSQEETQSSDANDINKSSIPLEQQIFKHIPIVRIKKEDVDFANCAKGDTSQSEDDTQSQPKTETDSQEDEQELNAVPATLSVESKNIGIRIAREVKSLSIKPISNGTLPKSGKPMMSSLNRKINKPRGRPKRKELPMYQSQVCYVLFIYKLIF